MEFTLKIERYDPDTDQGRLQEFTVDAPGPPPPLPPGATDRAELSRSALPESTP